MTRAHTRRSRASSGCAAGQVTAMVLELLAAHRSAGGAAAHRPSKQRGSRLGPSLHRSAPVDARPLAAQVETLVIPAQR